MLSAICMLIPALIMSLLVFRCWYRTDAAQRKGAFLLTYAVNLLLINAAVLCVLLLMGKNSGAAANIDSYNNYALKYILLSSFIAVFVPLSAAYVRDHVRICVSWPANHSLFSRFDRPLAILYALVLIAMALTRTTNNVIWGDEGYTIQLAQMSFGEMIAATASDVHPPLYYLIVQLICKVFGHNIITYQMVSIIPYIAITALGLSLVWKKWGRTSAILFISFAALLDNAITYNLEIRMYSWAALFVFLSFSFLYDILNENRTVSYVGFVISSLCAAYTHYYALVSVAFFYAALLIVSLFRRKQYLPKVLAASAVTVLCYLPWFFVLISTFKTCMEDFWLQKIPGFTESLLWLFDSKFDRLYLLIGLLAALGYCLYELNLLCIQRQADKCWHICIGTEHPALSNSFIWALSGVFSILGTILSGLVVSKLFRPFFMERYLFPVSCVAWLLLSVMIGRLKGRTLYGFILLVLIWSGGIGGYNKTISKEQQYAAALSRTFEATAGQIDPEDMLFTDIYHIDWTIADYYYPGVPHQLITSVDELAPLDPQRQHWLVYSAELNDEQIHSLSRQGLGVREVVAQGGFGRHFVWIYEILISEESEQAQTTHVQSPPVTDQLSL